MPIHIAIQPTGVQTVTIEGESKDEQDASVLAWLLVSDRIAAIDRLLVKTTREPVERKARGIER